METKHETIYETISNRSHLAETEMQYEIRDIEIDAPRDDLLAAQRFGGIDAQAASCRTE